VADVEDCIFEVEGSLRNRSSNNTTLSRTKKPLASKLADEESMDGLAKFSIALVTVSYQAVRAALMNPVKSLRSE
jgi:hypothetical protein